VDVMLLVKAAIMGLVEGFTEFLPISSTGHLILAGALLGFDDEKAKVFDIAIQTGAIFAVILVYWQKIRDIVATLPSSKLSQRFAINVLIAFTPAVILGLLFGSYIKAYLFTPIVVATTFILGGFIILLVEKLNDYDLKIGFIFRFIWTKKKIQSEGSEIENMTPLLALKVGLMQCFAMIPGTSRSGATIIGGMWLGLSRKAATDFSFYLAIPTLIGAGVYSLYKERALLSMADLPMFSVGLVVSFISAWLCIRWLLKFIATHSFVGFAYYRIAFGLLVWLTAWQGWIKWAA
jgi:undecaprenyl-diphosphatase